MRLQRVNLEVVNEVREQLLLCSLQVEIIKHVALLATAQTVMSCRCLDFDIWKDGKVGI